MVIYPPTCELYRSVFALLRFILLDLVNIVLYYIIHPYNIQNVLSSSDGFWH